MDGIAHFVHII